eukprot:7077676-Alexandrium_andersonii.AAC.1
MGLRPLSLGEPGEMLSPAMPRLSSIVWTQANLLGRPKPSETTLARALSSNPNSDLLTSWVGRCNEDVA